MYDFGTLIQILLTIVSIYIALYFYFKKEFENNKKLFEQRIQLLNNCTIIAIYIFILLYLSPYLLKPLSLFIKEFLNNSNFIFSYITETIFSIVLSVLFISLLTEFLDSPYGLTISIMISILMEIGLLWLNYYISLKIIENPSNNPFPDSFIYNNFIIKSIMINLTIYFIILFIILGLFSLIIKIIDIISEYN